MAVFDCHANVYVGVVAGYSSITATLPNVWLSEGEVEGASSILATVIVGKVVSGAISNKSVLSAYFEASYLKANWVAWSKIGQATHTIDQVNDAGTKPMSWAGYVYQVKELGKNLIVYGSGGVTLMYPVSDPAPTFGFKDLYKGAKHRYAIAGNKTKHYFIDSESQLVVVVPGGQGEGFPQIKILGYSEYLSALGERGGTVLLHYDPIHDELYLCDGTTGYILSDKGLGGGPSNLTGLQQYQSVVCAVYSATPEVKLLNLCTDIVDVGTRDVKCLYQIDVAHTSTARLQYSVDYRYDTSQAFKSTTWRDLNAAGKGFVNVSGSEFRVKVRSLTFTDIQIDDLEVYFRLNDRTVVQEKIK